MKLTLEQIKSIVNGAVRVEEADGKISFFRFTEAQEAMYLRTNKDFWRKTFATAGVSLEFVTSSKRLTLDVTASPATSRTYFNFDIYVNGERRFVLGSETRNAPDGIHMSLRGEYELGEGEKKVKIYFPWTAKAKLNALELDDGASIAPVEHSRRLLIFGDSITHGYDAAEPSRSYAAQLVDALDARAINKGIGGEVFNPLLSALPDEFSPDVVTVAYGTNDWSHRPLEEFLRDSEAFFANLWRLYPNSKIFALTPVWRGDIEKKTPMGEFSTVTKQLKRIADAIPTVTVIDCLDFIPHDALMYGPDVLHPNFLGFSFYADGVIEAIKKYL